MVSDARNHPREPAGEASAQAISYGGSSGSGKVPFRHIDDIVSVSVDLDPHAPMRKVLETGDAHMRQAITFKDFGRPDLALQEYIKASTIAVDRVPKHKDYPSLKSDHGDLSRLYHALKVKITNNGVTYDGIKEMIKQDNLRSGVCPKKIVSKASGNLLIDLPSVPSSPPSQRAIDTRRSLYTNHTHDSPGNTYANGHPIHPNPQPNDGPGLGRRAPPIVHPKPQALHGNSVKPAVNGHSPDLVARFAKLRDAQEPRNSSSSPPSAKPAGPRAMPLSSRLPLSVQSSLPAMPKVPDAIYSPARGTVTSEVANLPSSTTRGMFSRTNSIPGPPSRASMESTFKTFNGEQFATANTHGDPQTPTTSSPHIPKGELITVKELLRYMTDSSASAGTKILLIDVRDRQLFDEGHIMSQNTICLDPTVLSRQDISASEIVDSMILAPQSEKLAFERRDEVDLVIFYDQDSESVPPRITGNIQETIVFNLRQALVHYSFPKQLVHTPKLLVGGLNAWIDERGQQSLQTSKTQSIVKHATLTSTSTRQRLRNRTLKPEEVNTFEAMIGRDENGDFDYIKSREDFMRRFPSLKEPESMVSNDQSGFSAQDTGLGGQEFLKDMTPMPPVLPKPSVARTRYSGLQSADEHPPPGGFAMSATPSANSQWGGGPTGLVNPHNWCYANSSIQALLACRGFVDEFLDSQWPTKYRPDVSPSDPAYNQLMCRILGNLIQWLSQKNFATMKASTLMHYLRTIHTGYQTSSGQTIRFGDSNQHDSDEFITFVFGQLEVETRIRVTKNILPQLDTTQPIGFIADRWGNRTNNTIVSRHWYLMELHTLTCKRCKARNFIAEESERYEFAAPSNHNNGTLQDLVKEHFDDQEVDSECDKCKSRGKIMQKRIVRLPPLLRVGIQRTDQTSSIKLLNPLEFPFDEFRLDRYALNWEQRAQIASLLGGEAADGFDCPPRYSLFAVVAHAGENLNAGHYISYIRTDDGKWTQCNDTRITTSIPPERAKRLLYSCDKNYTPVQLYYRRGG
ncbi:putative ubiquitin carboxyl-terminal hydrolase [Rosellinia necatrix]|uniref:Putative ubiquitin carboxyl-terminal hydrolase n=1 Tax=Rosellinia necatrix TaxID=77044 RepID=A0A1W2TV53_ROSNE|nr:putative ubiquitin carboxyl-terminal hydrolase [Rosellinia necatrix]